MLVIHTREIFGKMVFSSVWKVLSAFVNYHRVIGGLGIAGVRVIWLGNFEFHFRGQNVETASRIFAL